MFVSFVTIDRTLSGSNRFLSIKLIKSREYLTLLLQTDCYNLDLVARYDWFLRPLRRIALLFPTRETNVYFVRGKTFQQILASETRARRDRACPSNTRAHSLRQSRQSIFRELNAWNSSGYSQKAPLRAYFRSPSGEPEKLFVERFD